MRCSICKAVVTVYESSEDVYESSEDEYGLPGVVYGSPKAMICGACSVGAKHIVGFVNKLKTEKANSEASDSSLVQPICTLSEASRWMVVGFKETEEKLSSRISFLHGCVDSYRNRTSADILLKPGNDGSPLPAHKALLAARSKIFKTMVESDICKAPPLETIALPELNHEELEALLEFLYIGSLTEEKLEKLVYPLSLAAHKYEITYLEEFCQNHMLNHLDTCNALLVLETANVCLDQTLMDHALKFIVKHNKFVVFSAEYETFCAKNPHLSVQIAKAMSINGKFF